MMFLVFLLGEYQLSSSSRPTELSLVISEDVNISFDWATETNDSYDYDIPYVFINNEYIVLPIPGSDPQSGTFSFSASSEI